MPDGRRPPQRFETTRWSVVLRAGRPDTATRDSCEALARLCRTYWFPLYAHVRRRGCSKVDAEDLTQAFFARLLQRHTLAHADPRRGRFRTFILTTFNHFLTDEWEKERTVKRGGGCAWFALDFSGAEDRVLALADSGRSPDRAFDRAWALALLEDVLGTLEEEYRSAGRAEAFAVLKPTLTGARSAQPYAELAARLGRSEAAVKVAVHRLRQRYRALLEAAMAATGSAPEEAAAELHHLLAALRG